MFELPLSTWAFLIWSVPQRQLFSVDSSKRTLLSEGMFYRGVKWCSCHPFSPWKKGEREKMLALFIIFWRGYAWKRLTHLCLCVCCFGWSVPSFGHADSALKTVYWVGNARGWKTVLKYTFGLYSSFLSKVLILVLSLRGFKLSELLSAGFCTLPSSLP